MPNALARRRSSGIGRLAEVGWELVAYATSAASILSVLVLSCDGIAAQERTTDITGTWKVAPGDTRPADSLKQNRTR